MVGVLIVSHSQKLAASLVEFLTEIKVNNFNLNYVGGIDKGKTFGTNPYEIYEVIKKTNEGSGVLVICDLGSSIMNTEIAIEMLEPSEQEQILIANTAFLEGAIASVVNNNSNLTVEQLKEIVEKECYVMKI